MSYARNTDKINCERLYMCLKFLVRQRAFFMSKENCCSHGMF